MRKYAGVSGNCSRVLQNHRIIFCRIHSTAEIFILLDPPGGQETLLAPRVIQFGLRAAGQADRMGTAHQGSFH